MEKELNLYYIHKDKHHPEDSQVALVWKPKYIEFEFELNYSCYLDSFNHPGKYSAQLLEQVNKIGGVTFDLFAKNSIRLGWYSSYTDPNVLMVLPYLHRAGKFEYFKPDAVAILLNTRYKCRIRQDRDDREIWTITLVSAQTGMRVDWYISGKSFANPLLGYLNNPFFGGKEPAPNGMIIGLKYFNTKKFILWNEF